MWISTGDGFESRATWGNNDFGIETDWQTGMGDFNGDGKADFWQHRRDTTEGLYVWLSKGDGLQISQTWGSSFYAENSYQTLPADVNGDGLPEFCQHSRSSSGPLYVWVPDGPLPDLVSQITSPLGAKTSVEYTPSSSWENQHLPFILETAYTVTVDDDMGHTASRIYYYSGGKFEPVTREFRGFEQVEVVDNATGFTTETHYHQDQSFQGRVNWSESRDPYGVSMIRTDNTWNAIDYGDGRTFAYIEQSVVTRYDEDGYSLATITTDFTYDNYGNLSTEDKQASDGITKYTVTQYANDTTNWILGKPTNLQIGTSPEDILRESRMSYDSLGRFTAGKLVHNEGGQEYEYTTTYAYDTYGNVTSVTNPRNYTITTTYDTDNMFPIKVTNPLNQEINQTYDPDFGVVLTETDANNQTVTHAYDQFGRKTSISFPDGSSKTFTYYIETGGHYMSIQASASPDATVFYDNLGREIEKQIEAAGQTIITTTWHDDAGRVICQSLPYFENDTPYYSFFYYDYRGRLVKQTHPDNTYSTIQYNGFIKTLADANGNEKILTMDSLGRLIQVEEATGGITEYTYDIFDNLTWVKDPIGNETTVTYDDLGRKISMDDPYMGHWEYGYDSIGNLTWQKDAKNQEVTLQYDPLNRMIQKNYQSDGRVVTYTYDEERTGYYNKGDLTTVAASGVTTEYNFDDMGRNVCEVRNIAGTTYAITQDYDLAGRISHIIYPDGTRINYSYHPMGNLKEVEDNATSYTYAEYSDHSALGQIGSVTYGNGVETNYTYWEGHFRLKNLVTTKGSTEIQNLSYAFDNVGNITGITDSKNSVNHEFYYDNIDRLIRSQADAASGTTREYHQEYTYDLAGNMLSKQGKGGWHVTEQDNAGRPTEIVYNDQQEDMPDRSVVYNQDNKPVEIGYNGTNTYIYYDGEGNRYKKVSGSETVVYVAGIYEIRGGQATLNIFANGKRIASVQGTGKHFHHGDHLGSAAIVTDESGNVVEEFGYLPFGNLLFHNVNIGGQWETAYLFTGQEWDAEYALYNYNARLYDPILCRFISADTLVPDYTNPQSLNRYAYCGNNPLKYVDPSGHGAFLAFLIPFIYAVIWGAAVGTVIGGAMAIIQGGDVGEGMLMGAITGAISSGIFYGAGTIATFVGQTAAKVAIHAVAGAVSGGINAAITGGDILQGALIGGVTAGICKYVGGKLPTDNIGAQLAFRTGLGAVVGGVSSELAGGDFAEGAFQGAWTSAFAYLFNHEAHKKDGIFSKIETSLKNLFKSLKMTREQNYEYLRANVRKEFGFGPKKMYDLNTLHVDWNCAQKTWNLLNFGGGVEATLVVSGVGFLSAIAYAQTGKFMFGVPGAIGTGWVAGTSFGSVLGCLECETYIVDE